MELPPFLRDKLYADFTSPEQFNATFPQLLRALGVKATVTLPRPPEELPPPAPSQSHSQRRLAEFEDLMIIDLDLVKSYNPSPNDTLYNMYLKLSRTPPEDWQQIFDAERSFPRHTMWRKAWIESAYIVIYCPPEELEKYHMRDLLEDVKNSNMKYRNYLTELAQREARETSRQQEQHNNLRDIKRRLGFD